MIWFIHAIFEIIATIIAYLTNPIVCLFADEFGNLPKCLRYWQTYDNCLDVDWMLDIVPSIFKYDFHKHYIYVREEHTTADGTDIVTPGYVIIIDDKFSIKERIQRYFCRLSWLYRNCNYGFSYEVNGVDVDAKDMVVVKNIDTDERKIIFCYDKSKSIFFRPWCFFTTVLGVNGLK